MGKNARDAVIVAYGRAPLGRANKGGMALTHPIEYAAEVLKGVLARVPELDPKDIDDVVVGCATPEKYLGFNVGRLIVQRAQLPDEVSAQTINRFCSSGLQSIATASNAIRANEMDIVVAGGVEMMTGLVMGQPKEFMDPQLLEVEPAAYMPMGITAENVAHRYNISREDMEKMACESHQKAAKAQAEGKFDYEIIPVTVRTPDGGTAVMSKDDGIRPSTNMEGLAKLKTCFIPEDQGGVVTAATSSQMTDGAGFVVLMAREKAEELGIKPIARFVSFAVGGVRADEMGIGPTAAVPKVMKKTGLTVDDMDVIEINEAFASQALYCIRTLGMDPAKVNPNGGAMALGHPLGATGAVLTSKILSELKRTGGKYGLVTMCIGGGMGAAGIFEME